MPSKSGKLIVVIMALLGVSNYLVYLQSGSPIFSLANLRLQQLPDLPELPKLSQVPDLSTLLVNPANPPLLTN